MSEHPEPTNPSAEAKEREAADEPSAVDELHDAAGDPASSKRKVGDEQAAANRDEDPPA